ncbi:MAG: hypothetical protein ABJP34_01390 [Erythrobacter sp.]
MSKTDFEAGRQHGWSERDQYIKERQQAFGRSMFGWPMMGVGGLIVLWCALIFGLSGTETVTGLTLALLLTIGCAVGVYGWHHNRREREEQLHRIDDFEKRWGIERESAQKDAVGHSAVEEMEPAE